MTTDADVKIVETIALYATIIVLATSLATTIIGGIAFWKAQKGAAKTFSLLLQRANALQMLAVILIIVSAVLLSIMGKITPEAVVSILSGVAGYVLGGVTRPNNQQDVETDADEDSPPKSK